MNWKKAICGGEINESTICGDIPIKLAVSLLKDPIWTTYDQVYRKLYDPIREAVWAGTGPLVPVLIYQYGEEGFNNIRRFCSHSDVYDAEFYERVMDEPD